MRLDRIALASLGALALPLLAAAISAAGCAGTDEDRETATIDGAASGELDGGEDGDRARGPSDAGDSGSASDASDDADAARDADAGPECTAGGWCYTTLPATDAGAMTLTDVWASHDEAWAVSEEGLVLHWKDDAWSIAFDAGVGLRGVRRDHEGTVWAVGSAGSIFRHAAGASDDAWSPVPAGNTFDLVAICEGATDATSPQNLWIAGQSTILMHWTGDGDSSPAWSVTALGPIEIRGMWCSGTNVWAVGMEQTSYQSALYFGSGGDFTKASGLPSTQFARPYSAVWASSPSDVWLADISKIVHGPGGEPPAWSTYPVGDWYFGSPTDWDFWGDDPSDVWAVGRHGRIYHYDGTNLQLSPTSIDGVVMTNNLHGISGASSDDLWVVGDGVALHRKAKN